ncbi:MAG TPA: DnaJ domain-containing protein [Acidobacteriaceae bacterium]|nr:DnaJ domain-containing protein [Acidobacteriaceae bacterium]
MKKMDYYEFLQISPNAEEETIHRVYRFLAARYHPDNPTTGDADQFAILTRAYEVLSDPERRARYNAAREKEGAKSEPLSTSIDFMDQFEGESNRRLALLAVLYYRRRANPGAPEVTLAEVEKRMGFPRDYLDFTTWYLQKKGYITRADNSDFTLTAEGVDFVETQRVNLPILNKLLTPGEMTPVTNDDGAASEWTDEDGSVHSHDHKALNAERRGERRVSTDERRANPAERRAGVKDRRQGKPDWRANPIERRRNVFDRRRNPNERRVGDEDRRASTGDGLANPSDDAAQQ